MNLTESEYRDIINSRHLINEKIKECKLVLGGKIPPMVDVGRQSSTLVKSKETEKLEKSMTRLLLAKRKAMEMLENGESSEEEEEEEEEEEVDVASKKKVKVKREKKSSKVAESTLADGSEDEDSDA